MFLYFALYGVSSCLLNMENQLCRPHISDRPISEGRTLPDSLTCDNHPQVAHVLRRWQPHRARRRTWRFGTLRENVPRPDAVDGHLRSANGIQGQTRRAKAAPRRSSSRHSRWSTFLRCFGIHTMWDAQPHFVRARFPPFLLHSKHSLWVSRMAPEARISVAHSQFPGSPTV